MNTLFKSLVLIVSVLCVTSAFAADTIRGTVLNQTTGKPAVGDEVTLIRLGEGMQQESRATTDAQGAFTLNVDSPQAQHMVQVTHQGVNYDQPVTSPGPVGVVVYDAVAQVPGLGGPMGIAQLASDGKVLKVSESYEIRNTSNPPVTQSRADNFEITVPADAVLESVLARKGQGIWLKVAAEPVPGHKGKYRVNFPIRPGATQFSFVYHLPYPGSATLHLKAPYPIEKFGIMHPTSMTFQALDPDAFKSGRMSDTLMVEQPVASPVVGEVPVFVVSGTGVAPQHGTEAATAPAPPIASATPSAVHPQQSNVRSPSEQPGKELWLMIAGIVVILGIGGVAVWRKTHYPPAVTAADGSTKKPLLEALKEELFQLESDRLHGAISPEEYATTKKALNDTIQRAIARK